MTASTEVNTCTRRRSPGFFVETLSGSGLGVTLGEGCKWIHLPEATGTLTRVMMTTTSSICTDTIEPKISEGGREESGIYSQKNKQTKTVLALF